MIGLPHSDALLLEPGTSVHVQVAAEVVLRAVFLVEVVGELNRLAEGVLPAEHMLLGVPGVGQIEHQSAVAAHAVAVRALAVGDAVLPGQKVEHLLLTHSHHALDGRSIVGGPGAVHARVDGVLLTACTLRKR